MIKNWKFWLGMAISAIALFFTLRGIHFDEMATILAQAQVLWLIPAFLMLLVTLSLRTLRWSSLMGGTPFSTTFHALNIGYLLNSILPFRLGEIGRAYVIGERTDVTMSRALSTVVVERIIDLATIVLMFAVFAQFIPMPSQFASAAITGAVVVIAVLLAAAVAIWQSARLERMLERMASRISRLDSEALVRRFRDLVDGLRVIRTPGKLAYNLALT
ncbi:MAG TPA: lysylphosphatidylglycerol synthase transmembrane domain-containing protein, partial [Anaerolineae bacterium]